MIEEIKARNQELMKAFANGDAVAAALLYAPDCHMMPHGRETVHGRANVEAYIKQDIGEGAKKLTVETSEVNGSGDWAYERGSYRLDGNRGHETGSHLIVWKKIQGKWHIYNDCFNVIDGAQG